MKEKNYEYILPDENNKPITEKTEKQSMIIIGANGSGKTRLGVWMEKNKMDKTHRIGAQRLLTFGNYINKKSYEQSTNLLLYGKENYSDIHDLRWMEDFRPNYVSSTLKDYEHVLSALVAMQTNEQEKFVNECKEKELKSEQHNKVPEMILDKLKRVWNTIFPHREINISDAKVIASLTKDKETVEYEGRYMSDGERVALYFIAQCLCVPENKILIIDEPETHLHQSIMNKIWTAIENERKDCFFIYITHDTKFAASHKNSKKIWVKDFDGEKWNFEEVNESELPEKLLLDILGNRKPVLFVEGTYDSYDTKIYSEIYKNYYVIPCGSCTSVISQTKSMNANKQLHHLKCYGIIDRDYRNDYEINCHEKDNIFTLKVAEVENLFLIEELLKIINDIMGFEDNSKIEDIKKYVKERFSKEIEKEICKAISHELKFQLTIANISSDNEEEIKKNLKKFFDNISFNRLKEEQENKFKSNITYEDILKIFNCKSLSTSTGHFFGLNNKDYKDFIIRQIRGEKENEIINALIRYLPEKIPLELK